MLAFSQTGTLRTGPKQKSLHAVRTSGALQLPMLPDNSLLMQHRLRACHLNNRPMSTLAAAQLSRGDKAVISIIS